MSDDDTMLVRILKIMPGNMLGDYCECRAARSGARPGTRAVCAVCERACPVQIDGALVWRGRGARAGAAVGLPGPPRAADPGGGSASPGMLVYRL